MISVKLQDTKSTYKNKLHYLYTKSKQVKKEIKKTIPGDFPGSPVVKTPHFPCKGHGFDPWSGN